MTAAVVAALASAGVTLASAQVTRDSTIAAHAVPVLTRADGVRAAGAVLAAAALLPFDRRITASFRAPSMQRSSALRGTARTFDVLGGPGAIALGVGAYALGRVTHRSRVTALGLHAVEALAAGEAVTVLVKSGVGRQRPYVDPGDPDDVAPGRGLFHSERASFPSGHTTAAFAVATVVSQEIRHDWPRAGRVVAPVAYGAAGLVGLARVYGAEHWASDVVAGATVGTLAGVAVERYARGHPHDRLSRWLGDSARSASVRLVPAFAPSGTAVVAAVWSVRR